MANNNGYAGKIKNSGTQQVKAPFTPQTPKGKTTVKTGNDLRTGTGGKK